MQVLSRQHWKGKATICLCSLGFLFWFYHQVVSVFLLHVVINFLPQYFPRQFINRKAIPISKSTFNPLPYQYHQINVSSVLCNPIASFHYTLVKVQLSTINFFHLEFFLQLTKNNFFIIFPKSHKILKMKQQKLSHTFIFTDKNMLNILVRGPKLYLVNNILWEEHPAKPQASFPSRLHLIAFGFIQSRIIEVKLPRMLPNPVGRKENASCQHNHLNSNMAITSILVIYYVIGHNVIVSAFCQYGKGKCYWKIGQRDYLVQEYTANFSRVFETVKLFLSPLK